MQVTSGASWSTSSASDHRRTYSVTVGEEDLREFGVEPDGLSGAVKHRKLGMLADMLTVEYMTREGATSKEFGVHRVQQLIKELKA